MKFSVLTLFPEMFKVLSSSIIGRAQKENLVQLNLVNIRDFSADKYHSVDDHPYGGGVGMVMRIDVIDRAVKKTQSAQGKERIILLDPRGKKYNQAMARRLSKYDHLIFVCGHYEGVDERVKRLVDESVSIGDYVLTGGEIPAMVLIDSITRLIHGVLKNRAATINESFHPLPSTLYPLMLEYPQYTKPQIYNKLLVPKILLSGDHKKIEEWRIKQAEKLTKKIRSDLLK